MYLRYTQGVYVIFWSSTVRISKLSKNDNHPIWALATVNFVDYSVPFILLDLGFSVIDATMIYLNERVIIVFKDERDMTNYLTRHKGLQIASAAVPLGSFK